MRKLSDSLAQFICKNNLINEDSHKIYNLWISREHPYVEKAEDAIILIKLIEQIKKTNPEIVKSVVELEKSKQD